ncbi:coiled-coil domain-containing protein 87 [Scleropages formosus]|nr:coiled-coil domain-containing protein 87 [Scleropages formosus]XP_018602639.2 coiled-coil domain-containing protein 87 [Scleropages formosus]XP_018602640.2 coiled-coil domain-containing protein 87 [Scleropages formosus]
MNRYSGPLLGSASSVTEAPYSDMRRRRNTKLSSTTQMPTCSTCDVCQPACSPPGLLPPVRVKLKCELEKEQHRCAPISLSELREVLTDRVQRQCILHCVSQEDQQALTAVMMSELGLIWQDLRSLNCDPTLSQEENRQLRSEILNEILRVCEQLYLRYIHLQDTLRKRGVFSDEANRSRLGAQMATDCTTLLKVRFIRRKVTAAIKARRSRVSQKDGSGDHRQQGMPSVHSVTPKQGCGFSSSVAAVERLQETSLEQDLREIDESIGELDLECMYDLMPCRLEEITSRRGSHYTADGTPRDTGDEDELYTPHRPFTRLKSCQSMPELQQDSFLEEMGVELLPARPASAVALLGPRPRSSHRMSVNTAAEDLRRLTQDRDSLDEAMARDPEADMSPLISALPPSRSSKLLLLQEALQRLSKEEKEVAVKKTLAEEPLHPQGDVNIPLSPESICTAACHVSDTVLTETLNLQAYPPVYRDPIEEVDPSSVEGWERWDQNLFPGLETKVVCRESSTSISTGNVNFDDDSFIDPPLEGDNYKWTPPKKSKSLRNLKLKRRRTRIQTEQKKPPDDTWGAYTSWLQCWKSNLSAEDYHKYLSNQKLDCLSAMFQIHDSNNSGKKEDVKTKAPIPQHEDQQNSQRKKTDAQKSRKGEFVAGVWNVNSVSIGEFCEEPTVEEKEGADEDMTPVSGQAQSRAGQLPVGTSGTGAEILNVEQLQNRLEAIWSSLLFPDSQRLDMAVKYSSPSYQDRLAEAIGSWERTASLIQQREALLSRLELFEREASDPKRFFERGYRGTSIARMDESRHRQKLYKQIAALEKMLFREVRHIRDRLRDTVTYNGRPYEQKMRWDRIEMLYWLQEQRRVQALEDQGSCAGRLPPLEQAFSSRCGHTHHPPGHVLSEPAVSKLLSSWTHKPPPHL